MTKSPFDGEPKGLAHDFCEDVMAHLPPQEQEWRMERRTVLWWVRGWYVGRRLLPLPAAALEMPPTTGGLTRPMASWRKSGGHGPESA